MSFVDDLAEAAMDGAAAIRNIPASTYRLQFHAGFTFRDATRIVPYLHQLGITHIYASPYFKARPGSTHGYDVVDPRILNPEIGTEADYDVFLAALRDRGMSHILDTVPNHMGVATNENPWWNDVLQNGKDSRYASFFDIAWEGPARPEMRNKVLLPVLGATYGEVLDKGDLQLKKENDAFILTYFDRRFPIAPQTQSIAATAFEARGKPEGLKLLHDLLERQHYRLAWWRLASDEINYRRFFDINELAAVRMELPEVFKAMTEPLLKRVRAGNISGLRIDHPDGLYDPEKYFLELQEQYVLGFAREMFESSRRHPLPPSSDMPKDASGSGDRPRAGWNAGDFECKTALNNPDHSHPNHLPEYPEKESENLAAEQWSDIEPDVRQRIKQHLAEKIYNPPLYVVVEKILALTEPLRPAWPLHGTSGYDFLDMVNSLFVDSANTEKFTRIYENLTASKTTFPELACQKKCLILETSLAGDLAALARQLDAIAQKNPHTRDFSFRGLQIALRETIASFGVYRTYITDLPIAQEDKDQIETAIQSAKSRNPGIDSAVFAFIQSALLLELVGDATPQTRSQQKHFIAKFQQLTAPATAKGIEDTAFYIYNRLISLNEVGGDPAQFGVSIDSLHQYFTHRQSCWPSALAPLSTHDTKRSEDLRARINVLSEMPQEWSDVVEEWRKLNSPHLQNVGGQLIPAPNEEYLIYQTLIGAWPIEPASEKEFTDFVERIKAYLTKAAREAKVYTSWTQVNAKYESAIFEFIERILKDRNSLFAQHFKKFHQRITHHGFINSLAQTTLRLTVPGVPDTYQGTELWDFSLVDPDNRRPVNYEVRHKMLTDLESDFPCGTSVPPVPDAIDNTATSTQTMPQDSQLTLIKNFLKTPENGRIKLFLTSRLLQFRRGHADLFMRGTYTPLKPQGPAQNHLFAFIREHNGNQMIIVVPRLTSQLKENPWEGTRLILPKTNRTFQNVFTHQKISLTDSCIELSMLLSDFPVAVLSTASI